MSSDKDCVVDDQIKTLAPDALDSVLTDVKRRIGDQLTEVSGLNTRAAAGLTSGSIITAITALTNASPNVSPPMVVRILFVFVLVAYLVVVVTAAEAYWLRGYENGPDPDDVVNKAVEAPKDVDAIKRDLTNKLICAFNKNERRITRRLNWTKGVYVGVVGEAVLLAGIAAVHLHVVSTK